METCNSKEDSAVLQKILQKITTYKMMDNLDKQLKEHKLPRSKVAQEAGRSVNALNKIFAEAEDLRMSTFLRYWLTINEILLQEKQPPLAFESLIDAEMKDIIRVAAYVADEGVDYTVKEDRSLFSSMKVHFLQLEKSNALSDIEIQLINRINKLLEEVH